MATSIPVDPTNQEYLDENTRLRREILESKQREDEARQQLAPLAFTDLLAVCHREIADVQVEPDPEKCTKGTVGKPDNKLIPNSLREWTEFANLQRSILAQVKDIYDKCPQPPQTFPNPNNIHFLKTSKGRPLASELDLRRQQDDCVENMVRIILQDLIQERTLPQDFKLGTSIEFDNHANQLSEGKDESRPSKGAQFTDKVCFSKKEDNQNRLVLVIEYKPPHKLGLKKLKAGLKDFKPKDLIHRVRIPRDEEAKEEESSEDMVATVIAQVYTYMIDSGIQYAYLTTGEAFVFLNLPDKDRETLHYSLVVPKDAFTNLDSDISRTAIGQVLSFCILACRGHLFSQDERRRHRQRAQVWVKDSNTILDNMTPSPDRPHTPTSKFKDRKRDTPGLSGSPVSYRLRSRQSCHSQTTQGAQRDNGGDSGPPSPSHVSASPQIPSTAKDTSSSSRQVAGHTQDESTNPSRRRQAEYCSHQCLLGLVQQGVLDPHCPNYDLHQRTSKDQGAERHTIDAEEFRNLLYTQLLKTMNTNIEPLGVQGARGAIFKLTLASHGYTMIGKGTPPWYVPDLEKERAVYSHLGEIQGNVVPVCLGAIHLQRRYFYHPDVPIFYWLLLSFAGKCLQWPEYEARQSDVNALRGELSRRGISHGDLSPDNVLWDEVAQKLMVVDFERAITRVVRREALQELSSNRKRKQSFKEYGVTASVVERPRQGMAGG